MKKIISAGFMAVLMLTSLLPLNAQEISLDKIKKDLYYLASDSMKGRRPGSLEAQMAAVYIRKQFENAGLKLLAEKGFQKFDVMYESRLGKMNEFSFLDVKGTPAQDYTPYSFSENARISALCAFAGYGFNIHEDSLTWNDYTGLDVKGRWVLILRGDPEPEKSDSRFLPYTDERAKVLTAKDNGAAGVIFITGPGLDKNDTIVSLMYDKSGATAGIPVLNMKRSLADKLLRSSGKTVEELEKQLNDQRKPAGFQVPVEVKAVVQVVQQKAMTENVIGMLEGSDPVLKNEFIVIGGHFDHLGMGGPGSGSRNPDTVAIHNGADDNASGTVGVIALAEKFAASPDRPKRSMIFVAFTGEESGLLGSKYFTKNCPVDLKMIKAMFNLDMVGRLEKDSGSVMISGTGTSLESMDLIQKYNKDLPFVLKFSPEGYGASDHSSFYLENIPVFFFTTGAHDDYHTPFDDREKINYDGMKAVLAYMSDLITEVANSDKALTFQEAGPKGNQSRGTRFKVTLGILPDFAGNDNKGLRVDGVKKDGPASKGGLLKGDVIVAMNGKEVTNINDYMYRLKDLQKGQTVNVDVIRGGKKVILLIQL
ncbi:MAG: M20/M25/M40 family metallo-hydrolase [Bacteroidales bacterium]